MADDPRYDAATAVTGAGLLAGGGALRHHAVRRSYPKKARQPRIHALSMLRKAPKGKKQYWAGSALGALGLPPLALGTTQLIRGDQVNKADDQKRGFFREGLRGTKEALGQRADSYRQPVPTKLRAAQLGVGATAGAVGSVVARAALGRRGDALKPFLTPVAGGLAATGSVPLTNRVVRDRYPGYEVTPSGVRRKKKPIVMPSKMSSVHRPVPRTLRQDVNKARAQAVIAKADDKRYLGARTPYATQRAVTTASTHTPVIGPFVSAGTAARYAPPGQGRKAALRQWGMSSGVGIPAGIAGAYGGAHLANRSDKAHHAAQTLVSTKDKVEGKARSLVGLKEKSGKGRIGRAAERFAQTKAGKPFRTPRGAIGGAAGMVVARGIAGGIGDQAAITVNQNAQRKYNKVHHIEKAAGQTKREKHDLATQKRRTAALSTASGLLGLGSLGLIATGHRNAALTTGTIGSGIGGTNSLLGARVQRREAQNVDPVKKRYDKGTGHWDIPKHGLVQMVGSGGKWASGFKDRENPLLEVRYVDPEDVLDQEWTRARLKAHAPFKSHRHKVRARTTDPKLVYRVHKALNSANRRRVSRLVGRMIDQQPKYGDTLDPKKPLGRAVSLNDRAGLPSRFERAHLRETGEWTKLPHISQYMAGEKYNVYMRRMMRGDKASPPRRLLPSTQHDFGKAAPLEIRGSDREHHNMLRRYGDRGPLPKGLSREDRMKAYEARYVHHGGEKQNVWSRRAATGNALKNAGVGVGTAGGAAWLATRGKSGLRRLARHPNLARHAETTAVAGATIGGAGEMLAGYAHRRQASYANSPGGVAASALRRMRAYTPETT